MGKNARKSYVSGNMDQFGVDIMLNILTRLHVKSLKKIRCVCKLWLKIIDDHVVLHNMRVVEQTKINLVIAKKGDLVRLHKAYEEEKKIYAGQSPSEFCGNGYYPYGSCNGLFYFVDHKHELDEIMVSNPVSNEFKVLPPMNIECYRPHVLYPKYVPINAYGLGYDSSTNTYKAICVFRLVNLRLATAVHNLGTNSWRKISSVPRYPIFGKPVFVNGFLYWEWTYSLDHVSIPVSKAIVSFNVSNEKFKLIPHPPSNDTKIYRLLEFDGKLAAVNIWLYNSRTCIWILDDKRKKWRKVYSIDTTSPHDYLGKWWTQVAGNWKQDEIYLKSDNGGYWIYNIKTGHKKHKRLSGIDCHSADSVDVYSHTWSLISIPDAQ